MAIGPLIQQTQSLQSVVTTLEESLRSAADAWMKHRMQASQVYRTYGDLKSAANAMLNEWVQGQRFTEANTKALVAHVREIHRLEKEYRDLTRSAQALFEMVSDAVVAAMLMYGIISLSTATMLRVRFSLSFNDLAFFLHNHIGVPGCSI